MQRHGGPRKLGAAGRVALVGCDLALGGEGGGPNAGIDVAETLGLLVVLDGANVEVHAGGGVAGQEQQPGPPPGVPGGGEEWQRLLGEIQRALVIAALGRHHGEGAERGDFHLPVARSRKRRIIGRFRPVPVAAGLAEPADPELRRGLHVAVPQRAPGLCSAGVGGDRARGVALAFPAFRQAHQRRRAALASQGFHLGAAERMLRVGGPQEGVRCAGYVLERLAGEGEAHERVGAARRVLRPRQELEGLFRVAARLSAVAERLFHARQADEHLGAFARAIRSVQQGDGVLIGVARLLFTPVCRQGHGEAGGGRGLVVAVVGGGEERDRLGEGGDGLGVALRGVEAFIDLADPELSLRLAVLVAGLAKEGERMIEIGEGVRVGAAAVIGHGCLHAGPGGIDRGRLLAVGGGSKQRREGRGQRGERALHWAPPSFLMAAETASRPSPAWAMAIRRSSSRRAMLYGL